MLDLQTRVGLHEVEVVCLDEELEGPQALVVDATGQPPGSIQQLTPKGFADPRAGCHFDQLLVAALDAAVPLAEHHDVTRAVTEHLDLDVTRVHDQLLDVHAPITEGLQRLLGRVAVRLLQLVEVDNRPHPASAAT